MRSYERFDRGRFDVALCRLDPAGYVCIAYTDGGGDVITTDEAQPADADEIRAFCADYEQ